MALKEAIFYYIEQGQELSGAEKMLVNTEVEKFIHDYTAATGEEPRRLYGTIMLMAERLEMFGFKFPAIEQWRKEEQMIIDAWARLKGTKKPNMENRD